MTEAIREFTEPQVKEMGWLSEMNNAYAGLWTQEQQTMMKHKALTELIHKLKHDEIKISNIYRPFVGNHLVRLESSDKDEFIKSFVDAFTQTEVQLKSLAGQKEHRGEELGEARMRVMRMLWILLKQQHGFKDNELYENMLDYDRKENLIRPLDKLPVVVPVENKPVAEPVPVVVK